MSTPRYDRLVGLMGPGSLEQLEGVNKPPQSHGRQLSAQGLAEPLNSSPEALYPRVA